MRLNVFVKATYLICSILLIVSCFSEISLLTKKAQDAFKEGKFLTSLYFAENALLKNPKDKEALMIMVKSLLSLEDYQQAEEKLAKLFLISDDPELFLLKGRILINYENYNSAIKYFLTYLEKKNEPLNLTAFSNLAYCYFQIEDYQKALEYYQKYHNYDNSNIEVLLNIAYLFGYLGKSDSAINYYNKILRLDSTNYNALYNRSIEYQLKNKFDSAKKDLETLHNYYPDDTNVLMDLAKIQLKEKKHFGAINDLTKIIKIDSTNAEAYFLRGSALLELSRNFSACMDFIKAGELGYFEAYEKISKYCSKK